jgi:predicted RNA-binding protein with RPS1 domain
MFPVGKEIEADVLKVEGNERKISLTLIPQQQRRRKDKDSGDAQQYMQDSDSGMFTFKTLLEGAINKSNNND